MKQYITEAKRMQQLAGILKEDETPQSITVELTDNLVKSKNLYKSNSPISMKSGVYYNLGNTKASATEDANIFFATYSPEIGEIQVSYYVVPARKKGEVEWFSELAKKNILFPTERERINDAVKNGELKLVPDFNSSFEKNGLNTGSIDDRNYFKIIEVK